MKVNNKKYVVTKTIERYEAYLKVLRFVAKTTPIDPTDYQFVHSMQDLKLLQQFEVVLLSDCAEHPDWLKIKPILKRSGAFVFNAKF